MAQSPTKPHPARWLDRALTALRDALLMLTTLQTPGALLVTFYRRDTNLELKQLLVSFALAAGLTGVLRHRAITKDLPFLWGVPVLPLVLLVWAALLPAFQGDGLVFHRDTGLWLYRPGITVHDCHRGRDCPPVTIDSLGLRRTPNEVEKARAKHLVLVGDSYIFGSGVADESTLSAALNDLAAEEEPTASLIFRNGGFPGTNLETFPALIAYAEQNAVPDAFVLLVREDDLVSPDANTRRTLAKNSLAFRMLMASNVEPLLDFSRNVFADESRAMQRENSSSDSERNEPASLFGSANPAEALRTRLREVSNARRGKPLLVVHNFSGESENAIREWVSGERGGHALSVRGAAAWHDADTIPLDGHWSEEGTKTIASLLWPFVHDMMTFGPTKTGRFWTLSDSWSHVEAPDVSAYPALIEKLEPDSDSEGNKVLHVRTDQGEARLKLYRCERGEAFFRVENLCFSLLPGPSAKPLGEGLLRTELERLLSRPSDATEHSDGGDSEPSGP